jgi:hypothetical protein
LPNKPLEENIYKKQKQHLEVEIHKKSLINYKKQKEAKAMVSSEEE